MALDWRERDFDKGQVSEVGRIGGALLLVGIGIWIGSKLFAGDAPLINDTGYYTNIFTEVLSVALTIGVLNYLAERREDNRRLEDRKRELIREAGSKDNATAIKAMRELNERGWLRGENGALKDADLTGANLSGAQLENANLSRAVLQEVNLSGAYLAVANLSGADLTGAKLSEAYLKFTNLSEAYLVLTDLSGAYLAVSNLSGANLEKADLKHTYVAISDDLFLGKPLRTIFDENTILPDGTYWTPDTDWSRFGAFTDEGEYWAWRVRQLA